MLADEAERCPTTTAMEMDVPFLGSIPIDPRIVEASDSGISYTSSLGDANASTAFDPVVRVVLDLAEASVSQSSNETRHSNV